VKRLEIPLPAEAAPWPADRKTPPQLWKEFHTGFPMCSWCGAQRRTHVFRLSPREQCPLCPVRALAGAA